MTLVGPLLGARALVEIKAHPHVRGRGTALAGIVIGAVALLGWCVLAILWHIQARRPMVNGPEQALHAGYAGDIAEFKAAFTDHDQHASDAEAVAFLGELSRRYGRFLNSEQRAAGQSAAADLQGPAILRIPYRLHFENGSVEAEAAFVTFGPARVVPRMVFAWDWVRIIDPQRGDLIYPSAKSNEALAEAQPASQP